MRVGHGYDVHRLGPGVPLVLGGERIAHKSGLIGWSDADVLCHAVIDALLGAASLGDIGAHFPPGDPQYKGISSLVLLRTVRGILKQKGYTVGNIDATVVAEQPRLREHIDKMRANLASALGCEVGCVNIKASTQEELGFVGREEGMIAWAVALIE
jgi:2-C-methyl-D-erythritol 2,4-cyclodiphosphate synthase